MRIFYLILALLLLAACDENETTSNQNAENNEDIQWNVLEEAFELVNIGTVLSRPELPVSTYKSADDPDLTGDNEISAATWETYTPPLPYIKNTTRNLQFNESHFIASPGAAIGSTTYVTTSDGYSWAAMSMAINALWPYNASQYSGLSAVNAYYAGNLEITPPPGVVKVTANFKGQDMKFWANEQGQTGAGAVALERYFVVDQWGNEYIMHASGQTEQSQVKQAFEAAILPEGWRKETRFLSQDVILHPAVGSDGSFHYLVFRDSADNSYHQIGWSDQGSLMAQTPGMPIWGGEDANALIGTDANDVLHGAGGDDVLYPLLGDDDIWGDGGVDTVVLAGEKNRYYLVSYDEAQQALVIFDSVTSDIKTLYFCEKLQFDDATIELDAFF